MRLLITLLALTICFDSNAQKKLKWDITSSGDTLYSTPGKKLYAAAVSRNAILDELKSTAYKSSSGCMLGFMIQTGRTNNFSIGNGAAADIGLEDGTVVTIYTRNHNNSKGSSLGYGCFLFAFYTLEPKHIRQLKASPVKSIRINSSTGTMDYELKEKFSEVIKEQLELLETR
jgi:hypothetical protein